MSRGALEASVVLHRCRRGRRCGSEADISARTCVTNQAFRVRPICSRWTLSRLNSSVLIGREWSTVDGRKYAAAALVPEWIHD